MSRFSERPIDTTPTKKARTHQDKITIDGVLYQFQDVARSGEFTGRGGLDIKQPKKANASMEKAIATVDLANSYRYCSQTL